MELRIWKTELRIWNLELRIWNSEFGIRNMELGIWNSAFGTQKLKLGICDEDVAILQIPNSVKKLVRHFVIKFSEDYIFDLNEN